VDNPQNGLFFMNIGHNDNVLNEKNMEVLIKNRKCVENSASIFLKGKLL
jgi:hypothetical protein